MSCYFYSLHDANVVIDTRGYCRQLNVATCILLLLMSNLLVIVVIEASDL